MSLTKDDIAYPRDVFQELLSGNSPYAFYLFQWVPYQTEAKRWRLKLQHDVRTFDGREAFNIWPNADSCGPFKDHEVEFIRISKAQFGDEWKDPRPHVEFTSPAKVEPAEGWVLVPKEPTETWAYRVIRNRQPHLEVGCKAWCEELRTMLFWHEAMLAAAPKQGETE